MKITALVFVLLTAGSLSASAEEMYPGKVIQLDEKSERDLLKLCPPQHTCTFYLDTIGDRVEYTGLETNGPDEPNTFWLTKAIEFDQPVEDMADHGFRGQCAIGSTFAEIEKELAGFGANGINCKGTWPKTWMQRE